MAIVDCACYESLARDNLGGVVQTGIEPAAANLQVTISAGSLQSTAFPDNTRFVRVHTDAPCRIEFGVNPTAAPTSKRMAAGATEYFGVRPGWKLAVITTS